MGNDADRYRRFLDGDDNGLREIIDMLTVISLIHIRLILK